MEYRKIQCESKPISLLGFGCMRLPRITADEPQIDMDKLQEMVDYAYASGVNYFDTAYPYHKGLSELAVGQALEKYPRESFFLADKMPGWEVKTLEDADRIFEEQLKKCRVEYFDFYLCHALGEENYKIYREIDIYGLLRRKKAEGKIRHLGFSSHADVALLEEIAGAHEWDFAQIQLNYLDWTMQNAKKQYEILTSHGLPCIIMEPVRGGALATLCKSGVDVLRAQEPGSTPASWAIRFAASLPNVMTVLSGMTTMEHMRDNVSTMSPFRALSEQETGMLFEVAELYKKSRTVPCTGCRYCMDCPSGVDIPEMFALYNRYMLTEDEDALLAAYKAVQESKYAKHCVECRACTANCPQGIDIPERLKEVAQLMEKLTKE